MYPIGQCKKLNRILWALLPVVLLLVLLLPVGLLSMPPIRAVASEAADAAETESAEFADTAGAGSTGAAEAAEPEDVAGAGATEAADAAGAGSTESTDAVGVVATESGDAAGAEAAEEAEKNPYGDRLIDLTKRASISISFIDPEEGKPFSYGSKVGMYKVANIVTDENGFHYVYDELFASVGPPPVMGSVLSDTLAQKLNETADIKGISLDVASEELNALGKVYFTDLEPGLYMVAQTHRGTDSPRYQISPFLVEVPWRNPDGTLEYDVSTVQKGGLYDVYHKNVVKQELDENLPKTLPDVGAAGKRQVLCRIGIAIGIILFMVGLRRRWLFRDA